jgi:ATP synthase F1 complex assembly factor 2
MEDLLLPTKEFALAIAAEFASQGEMIHPASTPLYNLACTAIDQYAKEDRQGITTYELGRMREEDMLALKMGECLETDSVCYRVDPTSVDPADAILRRRQNKYYDPLISWFNDTIGGPLGIAHGLSDADHPREVYSLVESIVYEADYFLKAVLYHILGTTKSTVITSALVYRHISVQQAMDAARVEEEHQIEEHGFVEDGHDTARAHTAVKLASASALLWLSPGSAPIAPADLRAGKFQRSRPQMVTYSETLRDMEARGVRTGVTMGTLAPRPGAPDVVDVGGTLMERFEAAADGGGEGANDLQSMMVHGISSSDMLVSEQKHIEELESGDDGSTPTTDK